MAPLDDGTLCNDGDKCTIKDVCAGGKCAGSAKDCDDANPCTTDSCKDGNCSSAPIGSGQACDDGDKCTEKDECDPKGACSGKLKKCDDNNVCTDDTCDANQGCVTKDNTAACDDDDACTNKDACAAGKCAGEALKCDDGNACTDDSCDTKAGCVTKDNTAKCDDGDKCTKDDVCKDRKCAAGAPEVCDDKNPCTKDSCDPAKGCVADAPVAGAACDDGDACTKADKCSAGKCAGEALKCNDKNPCTVDKCNGEKGCVSTNDDTLKCDDGNPCTSGDACKGGKCGGKGVECDDKNPCTTDSCDGQTKKCVYKNNTESCDDGSACTEQDACKDGKCAAGKPIPCDDKNPCTTDKCDEKTGGCAFTPNTASCDDGNACTAGDKCAKGKCGSGKPKTCDDSNACTDDACDAKTGTCKSTAKPDKEQCDDGSLCTLDDACAKGNCTGKALKCDDGNECTTDTCDKLKGCVTKANSSKCDDGNPCTIGDTCHNEDCKPGEGDKKCDDGNKCTTDSCDKKKGCVAIANKNPCDDGDACTKPDNCSGGTCAGKGINCDDGKACTDDSCDKKKGCQYKNNTAACSDGSVCTKTDKCDGKGKCVGSQALKCDDGNACTKDSCDPKKGCVFAKAPEGAKCDDGNGCTSKDRCQKGVCKGDGKDCNDGNPCTTDSCANDKCSYKNNTNLCSDGDSCTQTDKCDGKGKCVGANPLKCNDANACTDDSCINKVGCSFKANAKPCDDGVYCTEKDLCSKGACSAGKTRSCADGNACTNDVCSNALKKCLNINAPNTKSCSDSNKCTSGDRCDGKGACKGKAIVCNDENPCTSDLCDSKSGSCVFKINAKLCGSRTVPMTEGVDYADKDWHFSGNNTKVKWAADNKPTTPGKLTGNGSLNFNDGVDYKVGTAKPKGAALSRFWIDASAVKGKITLAFHSFNGIDKKENQAKYDKRTVELSTDGFKTIAKAFNLDHSKHKHQWRLEAFDISALAGKKFQLRFSFDAADTYFNEGPGWFVDNINVYNGPIVAVGNGGGWTDGFQSNVNGWQFSAAYGKNKSVWAIDNTPSKPGAYGAGKSLNFNNGATYDGGTTKGNALSPVIDLSGVSGGKIALLMKTWYDGEFSSSHDKRKVEVSDVAFVSSKTLLMNNATVEQDGWRWSWLDLSSFAGKRVRIKLSFDSIDEKHNKYLGWFVDDLRVDNAPVPSYGEMITCNNKSAFTISKGNSSGANWAIDKGPITPVSADCALTFDNGKDFACPSGANKVSGNATSKSFFVSKPAKSGGKVWLTFDAFLDVEAIATYDRMTVYVRRTFGTTSKTFTVSKAKLKAWSKHKFDVTSFGGNSVYVRFTFDSRDCKVNTGKGVAIDNVMVRADK